MTVTRSSSAQGGFFAAVERLAFEAKATRQLVGLLPDDRLSGAAFEILLRRELLELLVFTATRRKSPHGGAGAAFSTLLCLLPRHALLVHLLRRAVPFAAQGVRTTVATHKHVRPHEVAAMRDVAALLQLDDVLSITSTPSRVLVASSDHDLVVVTGRQSTVAAVKLTSSVPVLGAAGRCLVLLAETKRGGALTFEALRRTRTRASCSRPTAVLIRDPHNQDRADTLSGQSVDLSRTISRLHPSIVLTTPGIVLPEGIFGYATAVCTEDGSVERVRGFARDPLHGWPGDYVDPATLPQPGSAAS